MKTFAALLTSVLLLAGCGEPDPAQQGPPPSPAIWQVEAPGGQTGWLFGTIHALPDGYRWKTTLVSQALDAAGVLVVEVADLGDASAAQRAFAAVSQSAGLPPLLQRVPPADRAGLATALDQADLAEGDFARTESWAAALLVANALSTGEAQNGVDRALIAAGKPVIGLEGFAAQFAIFDSLAETDQRMLLQELAHEAANDNEAELADAWIRGDMARLEREDRSGILADPELRAALLVDRNRTWTARIASLVESDRRPFVAVGASHMAGPDGLPAMLIERGFTVRRLR